MCGLSTERVRTELWPPQFPAPLASPSKRSLRSPCPARSGASAESSARPCTSRRGGSRRPETERRLRPAGARPNRLHRRRGSRASPVKSVVVARTDLQKHHLRRATDESGGPETRADLQVRVESGHDEGRGAMAGTMCLYSSPVQRKESGAFMLSRNRVRRSLR